MWTAETAEPQHARLHFLVRREFRGGAPRPEAPPRKVGLVVFVTLVFAALAALSQGQLSGIAKHHKHNRLAGAVTRLRLIDHSTQFQHPPIRWIS